MQPSSLLIDVGDATQPGLPLLDLDHLPRVMGHNVDLGTYEIPISLGGAIEPLPDLLRSGQIVIVSASLTNTGVLTLQVTMSHILSVGLEPIDPLTITFDLAPGEAVNPLFTAYVRDGYAGQVTDTVHITTLQGPTATYTVTTDALVGVEGLQATSSSPTRFGEVTTLTATVTLGSNVTYTWQLGDDTIAVGSAITHVYPLTGTYIAVVTASNRVSIMTTTTPIVITPVAYEWGIYLPIVLRQDQNVLSRLTP